MRIAVISDIHGNLEAFINVLEDIENQKIDSIVSLGDNIGYGADSEKVVQLLISNNIQSILGNHEMAALDKKVLRWFKGDVRIAIDKAIESLSTSSLEYINKLEPNRVIENCFFVHGFPPDSVRFYLDQVSDFQLLHAFDGLIKPVCFLGHTHKLKLLFNEKNKVHSKRLNQGITILEKNRKYIINAGSVGQSRDGDPNAKYMILDTLSYELETRFIQYDNVAAARKIINADIPNRFARFLDQSI